MQADSPYSRRLDVLNAHLCSSATTLDEDVEVCVVGAGFAGMCLEWKLREAGIGPVRIFEKGSDLGGTWFW